MEVSKKSWTQSSINKKMEFQRSYVIFSMSVNKRAWTKSILIPQWDSFPQNIRKTPNGYRKQELPLDNSDSTFEGGRQLWENIKRYTVSFKTPSFLISFIIKGSFFHNHSFKDLPVFYSFHLCFLSPFPTCLLMSDLNPNSSVGSYWEIRGCPEQRTVLL